MKRPVAFQRLLACLLLYLEAYIFLQQVHYEWLSPPIVYYISCLHGSERPNARRKVVEHVSMR